MSACVRSLVPLSDYLTGRREKSLVVATIHEPSLLLLLLLVNDMAAAAVARALVSSFITVHCLSRGCCADTDTIS